MEGVCNVRSGMLPARSNISQFGVSCSRGIPDTLDSRWEGIENLIMAGRKACLSNDHETIILRGHVVKQESVGPMRTYNPRAVSEMNDPILTHRRVSCEPLGAPGDSQATMKGLALL